MPRPHPAFDPLQNNLSPFRLSIHAVARVPPVRVPERKAIPLPPENHPLSHAHATLRLIGTGRQLFGASEPPDETFQSARLRSPLERSSCPIIAMTLGSEGVDR